MIGKMVVLITALMTFSTASAMEVDLPNVAVRFSDLNCHFDILDKSSSVVVSAVMGDDKLDHKKIVISQTKCAQLMALIAKSCIGSFNGKFDLKASVESGLMGSGTTYTVVDFREIAAAGQLCD